MIAAHKRVHFQVLDSEGVILDKQVDDVFIPRDAEGNVWLRFLLDSLRKHFNLSTSEDRHLISYFCEPLDVFVLAGQYPDLQISSLPQSHIGDTLYLKMRKVLVQVVNSED